MVEEFSIFLLICSKLLLGMHNVRQTKCFLLKEVANINCSPSDIAVKTNVRYVVQPYLIPLKRPQLTDDQS